MSKKQKRFDPKTAKIVKYIKVDLQRVTVDPPVWFAGGSWDGSDYNHVYIPYSIGSPGRRVSGVLDIIVKTVQGAEAHSDYRWQAFIVPGNDLGFGENTCYNPLMDRVP